MSNVTLTNLSRDYAEIPKDIMQEYAKQLNKDNYFDPEMNRIFCGASQLKQFVECEAQAMAQLRGEFQRETTEDMLVGSYVHAWVEGTLQKFIDEHPEIMASRGKNAGGLKEKFQKADEIIEVLKNDKNLYSIITQSEKEQPFVGQIYGLPFKIRVDMLNRLKEYFTDLKIMKSISEKTWSPEYKRYVNFVIAWKYDWQMAIYDEILKQNFGKDFLPNIMAVSKEKTPDKELITFATEDENSLEQFVQNTLEEMKPHILRVKDLKEGKAEPKRCGKCDYCKATKQITEPVYWLDLGE